MHASVASGMGASHPLGEWTGPLSLLTSALRRQEKMVQPVEGGRTWTIYHQFTQERLDSDVGRQSITCILILMCSFPPKMW